MQVDWELSQSLTADGHGVRGVGIADLVDVKTDQDSKPSVSSGADQYKIIAGSQGGTLMEFGVPSATLDAWQYQHDNAVTSVLCCGDKTLITGSKDAKIRIFDRTTKELQGTLEGHEKPVTSLAVHKEWLVSGSWDGSAKIWNWQTKTIMATLPGHENSVCVTILGASDTSLQVVTGSAGQAQPNNQIRDHTVRLWSIDLATGQVTKVYSVANDHDGPIRDVCVIETSSSPQLATCSNDGTVKLRAPETGKSSSTLMFLQQQQQHPPMLLSLCCTTDGCLVASAEDGHVIVWDLAAGVSEPQTILHASCVWRVEPLSNGDFCTASDDGTVRIFTRASERMASSEERQAFADDVAAATAKKQGGPSAEEVAKLPFWEQNHEKRGTSEGQVQLFQKGGIAIAAQWSMASQTWIEVGQVMGNAGGGANENEGILDGVRYDHVLPVELENAGSIVNLKIGYNNGENPFTAAQRFIDAHMLPQHHLSQIADYIQQRTGSGGGAPMLGEASAPTPTTGIPMATYQHIPAKHYLAFELSAKSASTTLEKMKAKLSEFNKLSDSQMDRVSALMDVIKATSHYHSSKVKDVMIFVDMLNELEPSQCFPALDLARLAVLHPDAADAKHYAIWNDIFQKTIILFSDPASKEGPAIPMLSFRLFSNALKGGSGSAKALLPLMESLLNVCVKPHVESSNKNVRLSLATLMYNMAVYAKMTGLPSTNFPIELYLTTLSQVLSIPTFKKYEEPAIMRTLQAVGTLCLAYPAECKMVANQIFLASKVEPAASPHSPTTKAAAKEVYAALQ